MLICGVRMRGPARVRCEPTASRVDFAGPLVTLLRVSTEFWGTQGAGEMGEAAVMAVARGVGQPADNWMADSDQAGLGRLGVVEDGGQTLLCGWPGLDHGCWCGGHELRIGCCVGSGWSSGTERSGLRGSRHGGLPWDPLAFLEPIS